MTRQEENQEWVRDIIVSHGGSVIEYPNQVAFLITQYLHSQMDLKTLQEETTEWAEKNFPDAKSYQPLLGAIEELGELAHAHLKSEQGIRMEEQHHDNKVDAIGDIIIYLAHYCKLNSIDLEDAVITTWSKVQKREWKV